MRRFQSRVVDSANALISAAQVTVFKTGTQTLASLFSGDGVVALTNSFKSDHLGVFEFYVDSGDYDIDVKDPITGFSRRFYDVSAIEGPHHIAILKSGDSMQGQLLLTSGSTASPGVGFVGNTNTGFYRPAPNEIRGTAGGSDGMILRSDSVQLRMPINQPTTPTLNESYVVSLDQAGLKLWFYAKESGGTLRSGSVALV